MKTIVFSIFILIFYSSAFAVTEKFNNCEFSCYFPGIPETKYSYIGDNVIAKKQYYASDYTILIAECIQAKIRSDRELANLIKAQAKLSNLHQPSISTEMMGKYRVGVYSGNTKASNYNIKIHGRLIVGEHSILHLTVVEQLEKFPSKYAVNFLDSFKIQ